MSKIYSLILLFLSLSFCGLAQDALDKTYYRHFHVQVKNLTETEFQTLNAEIQNKAYFDIVSYCSSSPGLLIRVDASYPARVNQIQSEIESFISEKVTSRRITSFESISELDKTNFCR